MFTNNLEIIDNFLSTAENKKTDYLKRENSNFVYSLSLMRKNLCNRSEEQFLMNEILPKKLVEMYHDGVVYIHDKQLSAYCLSVGCKDIAMKGLPTLSKNMIASAPTKRINKLLRHFSNVVVLLSQQVSGAVMLSQMTSILASYMHSDLKDESDPVVREKYVADLKEDIQSLIWELNMPLRSGSESAFSNITMEFGKPSDEIANDYVMIGDTIQSYKYNSIPAEYFDTINHIIIEVMSKGTGKQGIPFTFPLITIPVTDDFDWDNQEVHHLLEEMYNWGGVYFENFTSKAFEDEKYRDINKRIQPRDPSVSRSLCCRLNIDLKLLSKVGGGIFGSSTGSTGAVQVINVNMNRLMMETYRTEYNLSGACLSKDDPEAFNILTSRMDEVMEEIQKGHMAKREFIVENKHLYPTLFAFNQNLKNFFNVFSFSGIHEGLINIGIEDGITSKEGKALAHKIMQWASEKIDFFIERDKVACGIEAAPGENASIKLARHDLKFAKKNNITDMFVQGADEDNPYLTAGCMTPFSEPDIANQIENSAEFQAYFTSGSIFHNFLETKVSPEVIIKYVKSIFAKPITYITITPTTTSCMECGHKMVGDGKNIDVCPICGSDDLATFSRVIGYVKMIARKQVKVDDTGTYRGKYNFWSEGRRHDWAHRRRITDNDIK